MKWLRSLAPAGLALILATGTAFAQAGPTFQQSGSKLDGALQSQYSAGSVNETQTTITIPVMAGLCAYIDSLVVGLGSDATGTTGAESYTTTNLGNLAWTFFSVAGNTGQQQQVNLIGAAPYKSASCGVATTIVTPAQNAHLAYPMFVSYHYAP